MNFTHFDLGNLEEDRIVRVTLEGNAVNVLFLDDANYQNYAAGQSYHYIGGLAQRSPVHFQTPQAGRWHVVINLHGLSGTANAAVTLLAPGTAAVSNLNTQLMFHSGNSVREASRRSIPLKDRYDVFIAYVVEDAGDIVWPLAHLLTQRDVRTGFEEFVLKANSDLWRILDLTADFNYGIFIISKNFIKRKWRQDELDAIVSKITGSRTTVFPVWHNISANDMHLFSPELEKRPARYTGFSSLERIADELAAIILR